MTSSTPRLITLAAALGAALLVVSVTGCAAAPRPTSRPSAPVSPTAGASTKSPSGLPAVAGYAVGEFPPVPLFVLPDLSVLDEAADSLTIRVETAFADLPGVTVSPAHCDGAGSVLAGDGTAYLYGDGSGSYTGPDGAIRNYGDGSGSATIGGASIQNYGDGSGNYDNGTVSIQNYGDGSGNYRDATRAVQIYGDGSGNYTAGSVSIQNYGDGSGNYSDGTVSIQNYGDGSGNYADATLSIRNDGKGTATVNGVSVPAEPLPPVPRLGTFPPLSALAPIESCGTTITFSDAVLFDFARSDIRPDAAATLVTVADALRTAAVARAVISGHTDAVGSDAENQTLSEERARAVSRALQQAGVTASLTAEGHGESRPVAANEIAGVDNPAGRQLNRRVEIFLPASV